MKKLNIIFTSLIAFLMFITVWNTFNFNYYNRQNLYEYERIRNQDVVRLEVLISTHIIDDLDGFKTSLVDFFFNHDYSGRIQHVAVEDSLRTTTHTYIYGNNDDDLFSYYTRPGVVEVNWKSRTEENFYTNDTTRNNPNLIDYLDKVYYEYRDGIDTYVLNHYPLNHFLNVDSKYISTTQVFIDLYVHDVEKEHAIQEFTEAVLVPLGFVDSYDKDFTSYFIDSTDSTIYQYNILPLSGLNWTSDLTEMPKPLLLVAMVTLLLINIQYVFSRSKEFTVRKMNGNSTLIVFKKMMLGTLIQSIVVFHGTFFIMWLLYIHSFRPLALLFSKQILLIAFIYTVLIVILSLILYFYLFFKDSLLFLKKTMDLALVSFLSMFAKTAAVSTVIIPIIIATNQIEMYDDVIKLVEKDTTFRNSIGLGTYAQTFFMGYNLDTYNKMAQWNTNFKDGLIDFINDYEVSVIDTEYFFDDTEYFSGKKIDKLLTNKHYLENFNFYKDGESVDFSNLEHNFIIVPSEHENETLNRVETFDNPEYIYVDESYTHFMNVPYINYKTNPILYVMVDDYGEFNDFDYVIRKIDSDPKELDRFNQGLEMFNHEVGQFVRYRSEDIYKEMLTRSSTLKSEMYPLVGIAVFVTFLFSYLMSVSYIQIYKKLLAIKYIHGKSFLNRFGLLFMQFLISILSIVCILIAYNKSIDIYDYSSISVNTNQFILIIMVLVLIDGIITYFTIRNFNKNNIASVLKGEGE